MDLSHFSYKHVSSKGIFDKKWVYVRILREVLCRIEEKFVYEGDCSEDNKNTGRR